MAKRSRVPTTSRPDGNHSPAAASAYAVGYGRPPTHTKWKAGQSGNPRGRRKGQRNVRTVVEEVLNKRIRIREGNRTRSVTKLKAWITTMANDSLKGSAKAQPLILALLRSVGMTGEVPELIHRKPFTADDDALIENYLMRRRAAELVEAPDRSPKGTPKNEMPIEQAPSDHTPNERTSREPPPSGQTPSGQPPGERTPGEQIPSEPTSPNKRRKS